MTSVPVEIVVLVMLVPSTLTASMPVALAFQFPLGTYEMTLVPLTRVEIDPEP